MDVNLLPDELRKREEEELRRKANRPIEVPMSSPLKEEDKKQASLPVGSNKGQPAKSHEPRLPAARATADEGHWGYAAGGLAANAGHGELTPSPAASAG